jgi:hypothetical protein
VLEADRHAGEVLLGETNDSLVNVAEGGLLDTVVLDDLTEDTTVTTADDQDLLRVGVGVHGKVSDHLLVSVLLSTTVRVCDSEMDVRELIALGALDDVVEDEDGAVVGRLKDEDVLVLALLVVKNLLDLERHGLAGPHVGDLAEPAIYTELSAIEYGGSVIVRLFQNATLLTLDGGVFNGRHLDGYIGGKGCIE